MPHLPRTPRACGRKRLLSPAVLRVVRRANPRMSHLSEQPALREAVDCIAQVELIFNICKREKIFVQTSYL